MIMLRLVGYRDLARRMLRLYCSNNISPTGGKRSTLTAVECNKCALSINFP